MPITIDEKALSRESTVGPNSTIELLYTIQGTDDDAVVRALLEATSPIVYDGLVRDTYTTTPLGGGLWDGAVRYALHGSQSQYTFDTGGGTQHITQSIQTIASYAPPGETSPDFQGAIGVSQENVEGIDITVPVYQFTETHYFDDALVTTAYKATLFFLTGKTNNAIFKGFAIGEVLFLGASGAKRGDEKWEITFRFAASPNVTGLTVGAITGIAKRGWEYLWVRYADVEDTFAFCLVKQPIAAYVEQVYFPGDFSGLGIGT
jgi:hypothetical protein